MGTWESKMYKRLAEDITFILIKNKMLEIQSYEIYRYAIEIILLNGSLLLTCLIISILCGRMLHMLAFVLFFIPLRMFAGGYHCKKSEECFLCSVGMYGGSIVIAQHIGNVYMNIVTQILAVFSIIIILAFSPLIHSKHPLEDYQIKRNKKIINKIVMIDCVLYVVFCNFCSAVASSERIFVIVVAFALIVGRANDTQKRKNM